MVTPDEAAVLSGVGTRTIYAFVEAGRLHFMETSGGLLLFVCLNSLLNGRDDNSIRL
jgi:excisionase family DNA binding protein